eukprot:jgi/Ulvmu1/3032/UM015_0072.1
MGASATDKAGQKTKGTAHAVAGGLAGACARLIVGPLDVVKIRMQVQLEPVSRSLNSKYTGLRQALVSIVKEEGVKGLWRGTTPALALVVPYCAVQFAVLNHCKSVAASSGIDREKWGTALSFGGGAVAGAAATAASYPFDLLRTVLASQGHPPVYRGMADAAGGIMRQRGVRGLFSGMGITLAEIIPYAGIQFGAYDALKRASDSTLKEHGYAERMTPATSFATEFVVGFIAGLVSKTATHPLDVVKKRFQVAGLQRSLSYGARVRPETTTALRACVHHIWRTEGLAGFFKGLSPSLLKAAPYSAVTFATYEFFLGILAAKEISK